MGNTGTDGVANEVRTCELLKEELYRPFETLMISNSGPGSPLARNLETEWQGIKAPDSEKNARMSENTYNNPMLRAAGNNRMDGLTRGPAARIYQNSKRLEANATMKKSDACSDEPQDTYGLGLEKRPDKHSTNDFAGGREKALASTQSGICRFEEARPVIICKTDTVHGASSSSQGGNPYRRLQSVEESRFTSIDDLINFSKPHNDVWNRVRENSKVPSDINPSQFEAWLSCLTIPYRVVFSPNDMPDIQVPENGLNIDVTVNDNVIENVFVDNGAGLNLICNSKFLGKLGYTNDDIDIGNRITVSAYDGTARESVGTITLPIKVVDAPVKNTMFHIVPLEEKVSYSLLLGRPWIHAMEAIPSTYHQCIKFPDPLNGIEVIVRANQLPPNNIANNIAPALVSREEVRGLNSDIVKAELRFNYEI